MALWIWWWALPLVEIHAAPYPTYDEYKFLRDNVKNAQGMSIFTVRGGVTAKYESSSSVDLDLLGVVHGHKDVYEIPIEKGRYFTPQEAEAGRNVVILGFRPAKELFPNQSPIGKSIKIKGLKYHVIGVIKRRR